MRHDSIVEVKKPKTSEQWNLNRAWEAVLLVRDSSNKTVENFFGSAGATMALVGPGMASTLPSAYAGGTIKVDDDKFISIGMGIRQSFNMVEDGSASGAQYSNNFDINNARIYINGGNP